jgi:hypothetical protein
MDNNSARQETMDNGKNIDQYFRIANIAAVDISTRIVKDEKGVVNIAEFINGCFPLVESLRTALRGVSCPIVATSPFAYAVEESIGDILRFQEKWNLAYTSWYSGVKTRSNEVKRILATGDPWLHVDVQTFQKNSAEIVADIDLLVKELWSLDRKARKIIDSIAEIRQEETAKPRVVRKWWQFY